MADGTPVEAKFEAAALAAATTTAAAATKAGWWFLRSHTRLAMLLGGGAVAIAGGTCGYKYITATPGKVAAQSEPQFVAQVKEEPPKPAKPTNEPPDFPDLKLPEVPPAPPIAPVKIEFDPAPIKAPTLPPAPGETEAPPLNLPPDIKKPKDTKEAKDVVDPFKATDSLPTNDKRKLDTGPAPLATDVKDKKESSVRDPMPLIRIGAQDLPPVPKIEDKPPPPPAATKKDESIKLDLDLPPLPPTPGPKKDESKKDDLAIIAPSPPTIKSPPIPDVPSVPMKDKEIKAPEPGLPPVKIPNIEDPPVIKKPMIIDVPPQPPAPPITIDTPVPVAAPPKTDKKDMYDEDWHTQREGDTYTLISNEYYKTGDYGAALEAYNKDHRKSGERIIRVPPPWVLEEQFPGLINKNEKPAEPETKPTSNLKFEPVAPLTSGSRPAPLTSGSRPAPPPASSSASDEYRVKNPAGETIREIARHVYGDDNSWKKLWELNPDLDPTRPIPSGTTIRLGK